MTKYNQLWKDIVEGLKKEGYSEYGGNDKDFLIMRDNYNRLLKIYLRTYNNSNEVIVRFSE